MKSNKNPVNPHEIQQEIGFYRGHKAWPPRALTSRASKISVFSCHAAGGGGEVSILSWRYPFKLLDHFGIETDGDLGITHFTKTHIRVVEDQRTILTITTQAFGTQNQFPIFLRGFFTGSNFGYTWNTVYLGYTWDILGCISNWDIMRQNDM